MEENLYTPNCIRTFTGKYVNIFEPTVEMFDIIDVAHGLSNIPRFGGHLPKFYSVAQHSIHVAQLVQDAMAGLMHETSEGLGLIDMPSPIKNKLPDYKKVEHNFMVFAGNVFGFKYPLSDEVKAADKYMLEYEWQHLMLNNEDNVLGFPIYTPTEAKAKFLEMYYKLKNQ